MAASPRRTFIGMNIRGLPPMSSAMVARDLTVLNGAADAFVLQEFKWRWYWKTSRRILAPLRWGMAPSRDRGTKRPAMSAQPVGWRRSVYRQINERVMVLHKGAAGISDKRFLRAVLLEDVDTKARMWVGTTHFVVRGDRNNSTKRRKRMLAHDLSQFNKFLIGLKGTGYPIIFQLDANIHNGTKAWQEIMSIIGSVHGTTHGIKGIEFLFTAPGQKHRIVVEKSWTIPVQNLATDHEGRCIDYRLV